MDWTSEAIDQLRALWSEGHSTAEIGRRMGVTKNAIVGKAHRLNLPPRPSPIRREAAMGEGMAMPLRRTPPAPRPAPAPRRIVPAPPAMPRPVSVVPAAIAPVAAVVAPVPLRPALPQPSPLAILRPFPRANARSCAWPLGDPGTAEFRFCGCDALPTKPYCAEHAAVAYVKVRDRRDDAA